MSRPRRRPPAQSRRLPRWLMLDLLIIVGLALPWLGLVGYVAAVPPTRAAFGVDAAPGEVIFRNFYGLEQNATGPFRWAKPEASIAIPVSAPATYAITLTMQDSPAVPAPRTATIYANGRAVGEAALGTGAQQYRVVVPLSAIEWGGDAGRVLQIETAVAPFAPPGDPRQLGPIVSRIAIAPIERGDSWPLALAGAGVALAGLYALMRLIGLRPALAAGVLGLGMLGYAALALADRSGALALAYGPVAAPGESAALLAGLIGLPLLGGAGTARLAGAAPAAVAGAWAPTTTRARLAAGAALATITALGLGLRLYRLNHLSLWLDETATVYFSRQSWPFVLGLHGAYDAHPPLYYALIKLVRTVVPDVSAARLTSALAGAATLPTLAALVARLTNWRAGLLAALVLAVSPLHIWYSQEARMYAPVALVIALSYLALVAFAQTAARRWAVAYGVSVALALYLDYSAIYALAPQALALALIGWRWRRRALPIWGTALGAACCFLPWVPNILRSIDSEGRNRESFLGASPGKVASVALSAMGLKNEGNNLWGATRTFWERSDALQATIAAGMAATALIGVALLARRSPVGLVTALGLTVGTIATAILISLVSPGFAERTVLPATLGWAILLGVAGTGAPLRVVSGRRRPSWHTTVAIAGIALTLVASGASLRATYQGAYKEENRALAAAAAQGANAGVPVVAEGWLAAATTAYQPGLALSSELIAGRADQFWWAYGDYRWGNAAIRRAEFERLGYSRLMHRRYAPSLFLDYYARPGALPDGAMPVGQGEAWVLPPGASREGAGGARLAAGTEATIVLPAGEGVYLFAVTTGTPDRGTVALRCRDRGETASFVTSAVATGPQEVGGVAICPPGTASLAFAAGGAQAPAASYGQLRLWLVGTASAAAGR